MSYTVDPELLIQEIEKRPVIWDTNVDESNIRHRKRMAWSDISSILIPSFNNETEVVQKNIIHELSTKWKSIRTSYVSSRKLKLKILQYSVPSKTYRECTYNRQLAFLNKIIDYKSTEGNEANNIPNQIKNNCENQTKDNNNKTNNWCMGNSTTNQLGAAVVDFIKSEPTEIRDSSAHNDMDFPDASNPGITSNLTNISNTVDEDEDLAFFCSLLPFVKTLNKSQRLEFRLQTLQLAQSIKTNDLSLSQGYPDIHLHLPDVQAYSQASADGENPHHLISYIPS